MIEDIFRLNVPGRSTLRDLTPFRKDDDDDGDNDEDYEDADLDESTEEAEATKGSHHCDYLDMKGLKTVRVKLGTCFTY